MTTTKPRRGRKPKPKPLDTVRLAALAEEISTHTGNTADLEARLAAEEGLEMDECEEDAGIFMAKMQGVVAVSSMGRRQALENWANAVRRTLLREGV